jgi:hypothetical protein
MKVETTSQRILRVEKENDTGTDTNIENDISESNYFNNISSNPQPTGEDLSAQKAQEMAKNIYAKMVYEQQQRNISDMNVIRPANTNNM